MSFRAGVNVLIQFAENILYVKGTNGEMGTLFTINTKVRGDAFHCLFHFTLGAFSGQDLHGHTRLYNLKCAN